MGAIFTNIAEIFAKSGWAQILFTEGGWQYAVMLAESTDLDLEETFNDGTYDVPYLKLEPVAVTRENMDKEIISSRFHLKNEVYLNVDTKE